MTVVCYAGTELKITCPKYMFEITTEIKIFI